jgi:hypothetical protein
VILIPKLIVDRELTPAQRRVIDARLAESLEEAKRGDTNGPFETHKEMPTFLHGQAKKARAKKSTSAKPGCVSRECRFAIRCRSGREPWMGRQ